MGNIVVAIDFSKGANKALDYAVVIAELTGKSIMLIWVDDSGTDTASTHSKRIRGEAKKNFSDLLTVYNQKHPKIEIDFRILKGKVYQELNSYVKTHNSYMLIVGTHGLSGFEEYWIGTNAFRLVSGATCPVVTIRYSCEIKKSIHTMLLPIDHTIQTIEKVPFAAELAKAVGADVNILAINSSNLKTLQKVVDKNVNKALQILDTHSVKYLVDKISSPQIAKAIIEHARMIDVDLIVVTTDLQNQVSNVMLGNASQQLVIYSQVPVISFHPTL